MIDRQQIVDALAEMTDADYQEVVREARGENRDPKAVAAAMMRQWLNPSTSRSQ
jgi:hypothetical protein